MFIDVLKRGGFVTLICGPMALVFALLAQEARSTAQALADHGQTAIATVMDKERETTRRSTGTGSQRTRTSYEVTYVFEVDSQIQRVEVGVPEATYDDVAVGDRVEIRYLPEDPSQVETYPGQMAGSGTAMGVAAAVLAFIAVIAAGVALTLTRRARLRAQAA